MLAQKPGSTEKRRAGGERTYPRGVFCADVRGRIRATKEGEQAVRLDLRNPAELPLQLLGTLQNGLAQRVRRFEHEERLLAFGKHPLEFEGRLRHGIAGHHETLDGRIRGYPRGAVDAGQCEHQVDACDPVPDLQYVQKEPKQLRRNDDIH